MGKLISDTWAQFTKRVESGVIKEAHLRALMANPDLVLRRVPWEEEFLGLTQGGPDDGYRLVGRYLLYVCDIPSGQALFWGGTTLSTCGREGYIRVMGEYKGYPLYVVGGDRNLDTLILENHPAKTWRYDARIDQAMILSNIPAVAMSLRAVAMNMDRCVRWGDVMDQGHAITWFQEGAGEPLYALNDLKSWRIIWGQKMVDRGSYVHTLTFSDGKPLYAMETSNGEFVVKWGGKRIRWSDTDDGSEKFFSSSHHNPVIPVAVVNQKLLAIENLSGADKIWKRVAYDGTARGANWEDIRSLTMDDNNPLYIAKDKDGERVMWGTESYSAVHSNITTLIPGRDHVYIARAKNDDRWAVYVGPDEKSKDYDEVFSLQVTDTEVSFGARRGRRLFRVSRKLAV